MQHGLGHAEEHQPDPHAGAEQHREPRQVAVFRFAPVRAQLDVAVFADREEHDEDQETGHGQDIEPAEIGHDQRLQAIEYLPCRLRKKRPEQRKGDDQDRRPEEHRAIGDQTPLRGIVGGFLQYGIGHDGALSHPHAPGARQAGHLRSRRACFACPRCAFARNTLARGPVRPICVTQHERPGPTRP